VRGFGAVEEIEAAGAADEVEVGAAAAAGEDEGEKTSEGEKDAEGEEHGDSVEEEGRVEELENWGGETVEKTGRD
jgi:hypothetical protein